MTDYRDLNKAQQADIEARDGPGCEPDCVCAKCDEKKAIANEDHVANCPWEGAEWIEKVWTENTGGGCMVDYLVMKDGRVLTLTDESIALWPDLNTAIKLDYDNQGAELASLTFPTTRDSRQRFTDEQYRNKAKETIHSEGEIEVDDKARISWGNDGGAYVAAWVWISDEQLEGD